MNIIYDVSTTEKKTDPAADNETITLYHGSPNYFSAIDSDKIGLGQNFLGRGFYTDTSISGVHYVMDEINHQNFHIYEIEIPSNSIILDRWDNSSLTDELRERIREAGKTIHQKLIENGETSSEELGNKLADNDKIDETFFAFASSLQGMNILKEAGIAAIKDNSYVAIVNTDLIDNIRLCSAGGNIRVEMDQYIDKALDDPLKDSTRLAKTLLEQPKFSIHYDAIRSELVKLANAENKPQEVERLTSILTHTLVETIDNNCDRKTNITPLNRFYAEAIRALGLNYGNSGKTLGRLIDSAVVHINPNDELVVGPDKQELTVPEPILEPGKVEPIVSELAPIAEPNIPEPIVKTSKDKADWSAYPADVRMYLEHPGNRRVAMTDEQKMREWNANPDEYDAVYLAISDEIAESLMAKRQNTRVVEHCNTPSECFNFHLKESFDEVNEEYERRFDSQISGIDATSCLVLMDSIHKINKINDLVPGTSEFDEHLSFLSDQSTLIPVVISGEEYLKWFESNKPQIIEIYKMEDIGSLTEEREVGEATATQGVRRIIEEIMKKAFETCKSLLNDLRTKGSEHTPTNERTGVNQHNSPVR